MKCGCGFLVSSGINEGKVLIVGKLLIVEVFAETHRMYSTVFNGRAKKFAVY